MQEDNDYSQEAGITNPLEQKIVMLPEAVAVDLRGLNGRDTLWLVDTSQANPNCLYYVDSSDDIPEGLTDKCNLVIAGRSAAIRLTDNYDFYCPMPFSADYISYTLRPNNVEGQSAYAETLVLPFSAQGAFLNDINDADLHGEYLKAFSFTGCTYDMLNLEALETSRIQAYTPYVIAVGVRSAVTFYATDAAIPVTTAASTLIGELFFAGGTVFQKPNNNLYYRYHPEMRIFVLQEDPEQLPPFRAWICLIRDMDSLGETDHEETPSSADGFYDYLWMDISFFNIGDTYNITSVEQSYAHPPHLYSLSGISQQPGKQAKGLYITEGKKILVNR